MQRNRADQIEYDQDFISLASELEVAI
jgi:hypothetical protein